MKFTITKECPGFSIGDIVEFTLGEDGRYHHPNGFWMDKEAFEADELFAPVTPPTTQTFYYVDASGKVQSFGGKSLVFTTLEDAQKVADQLAAESVIT